MPSEYFPTHSSVKENVVLFSLNKYISELST